MKKTLALLLFAASLLGASAQTFGTSSYSRSRGIGLFVGGFMLPNHQIVDYSSNPLELTDYNPSRVSPHAGLQFFSTTANTGFIRGYSLYASYGTHVFKGVVTDTVSHVLNSVNNRISFGYSYSLGYNFDNTFVLLGGVGMGFDMLNDRQSGEQIKKLSSLFVALTGRYNIGEHFYVQAEASMGMLGITSSFSEYSNSFRLGDLLYCDLSRTHPLRLNVGAGFRF